MSLILQNKAAQKLLSVWNSRQVPIDRPSESKKARSDINSDFCESNHEIDNNVADGEDETSSESFGNVEHNDL